MSTISKLILRPMFFPAVIMLGGAVVVIDLERQAIAEWKTYEKEYNCTFTGITRGQGEWRQLKYICESGVVWH